MRINGDEYKKVAKNNSGDLFLLAKKEHIESGNNNGMAMILYPDGSTSKKKNLQIFYKFGIWYPVVEEVQ